MTAGIIGITEIAELLHATKEDVNNWRLRYDHFPRPIQDSQNETLWDRGIVETWIKTFNREPTHVLSFINLKGGVGKTTTAIAVAEMLAKEEKKRVLVIDLDPQTNATVTLISEQKWAEMDKNGRTIAQLYEGLLNPQTSLKFDIEKAIVRGVSTIDDGIPGLDLLPSSIRLIDIQDQIPMIALKPNYTINPIEILQSAIKPIINRYDYIIIDCPPSLGTVTKNGLRISTGYVIPTIPDILSTWGIYQIVDNINSFSRDINHSIPPLGIIATKYQNNSLHNRIIGDLQAKRLGHFSELEELRQPPLFKNIIPQTVVVARGADTDANIGTLRIKYGAAYGPLLGFTKEIKALCEMKKN